MISKSIGEYLMNNICNNVRCSLPLSLTATQIKLLNQIEYQPHDKQWVINKINQYIVSNYPIEVLVANYDNIRKLGRDSSSLKSFIIRFGEQLGTQLFQEKNIKSSVDRAKLVAKFGEAATDKMLKSRGASLENYIARHGAEIGNIKWDEYLKRRSAAYVKKHESGHIFPKYNLDYYISLYGEEKAKEIFTNRINSQRYKVSKAYYIEQYGPINGPIKCKEAKDHSSLAYFIKKHGEVEGPLAYTARCVKIAAASNSTQTFSNISCRMFDQIKLSISDLFYYGLNELTWAVSPDSQLTQRAIKPDLFYRGKIIEFNGDLFHGNPLIYNKDDTPHPYNKKLTAGDIWKIDLLREEYFISKGYEVLVIWESEYKLQPEKVLQKCIQFLTS